MPKTTLEADASIHQSPSEGTAEVADAGSPPQEPASPETTGAVYEPLLYVHVIVVAAITGLVLLLWLVAFYAGLKLLWENDFVSAHRWMFPVICLPFSLLVGFLVKYLKAPTAMSESLTDSLAGDTSRVEWRRFPGERRPVSSVPVLRRRPWPRRWARAARVADRGRVLAPPAHPAGQATEAHLRQRGVGLQRTSGRTRSSPASSGRSWRRPMKQASPPSRPT